MGFNLSHTFAHMRNSSLHLTHPITTRSSELLKSARGAIWGEALAQGYITNTVELIDPAPRLGGQVCGPIGYHAPHAPQKMSPTQ